MSPNVIKKEGFKNMKKTSASCFFKNNQGFSLMEMLIYVGILGIVASVATGIFLSVTKVQTEQSAQVEISGQLNFAMQTIQRLIRNSSLVDITPGTPTTSLTLRMKDSAVDPTTIYLENGRIYVKEGASGTPQSITSDKVVIDSLEFKKLTQYPGKDIVQIDLAMSAANKVEGSTIRRSLRSAVSRVSAATFDSDLIPGADNTYSVGTSNRWKNASFSGNVGIGVTTLLNKLDVAGGVAIGSYAGVNTAPSNGLIVSGNVGIGVATPAGGTKLDIYTSNANEIGLLLRDDGGARIFSIAELGSGGYNPMSSAGDIGLIYYGSGGSNTGSLMIGQWSSSARGIKIDASGNVGIGTGTPGEKLEVAGNIKLSGATPTYKITNVASPTASSDVATKGYVDAAIASGGGNAPPFGGDGRDGDYSCTSGTCTNLYLNKLYQFNNFTISSGATLQPVFQSGQTKEGGFYALVKGTCTIAGTITVKGRGNALGEGSGGEGYGVGGNSPVTYYGGGGTGVPKQSNGCTPVGVGGKPGTLTSYCSSTPLVEVKEISQINLGGAGGGGAYLSGSYYYPGYGTYSAGQPTTPGTYQGSVSNMIYQAVTYHSLNPFRNQTLMTSYGAGGSGYSSLGGTGGGTVYLECTNINFTGTIDASGNNGSGGTSGDIVINGGLGGSSPGAGGGDGSNSGAVCSSVYIGGGGGGGGVVTVLYKNSISTSGTINISGGNGGNGTCTSGGSYQTASGGGGQAGWYFIQKYE